MNLFYMVIGALFGIIISRAVSYTHIAGTLRVINSEADPPYTFLELKHPISYISKKKTVLLSVREELYTSQK